MTTPTVGADALRELAVLCGQLRDAERAVEAAEEALKKHKADQRRIEEEDIPGLMAELGVKKLTLETGETVSCKLEVYASITEANRAKALAWLEEKGFGALIDTNVTVEFERTDREQAMEFATKLIEEGKTPQVKEGVHASRLKSFLKERLEAGENIPLELFGARPVTLAKIGKAR